MVGYRQTRSEMLRGLADASPDVRAASALREQAYADDREALRINPLWSDAHFIAANSAWLLALSGFPNRPIETVRIYERLSELAPTHQVVLDRLPALYRSVRVLPGR